MIKTLKTGNIEYGRWIKALIVGEPGSGKTLISSTFPQPYYANAEGGLMSVASRRLPYATIHSTDELNELLDYLKLPQETRREVLGAEVNTIVIDTIDEVQRILIRERLASEKIETLRMNDWGWLGDQMQGLLRGFRNLEMNVIFTCHVKDTKDDESGRVSYKPALGGAIAGDIPGYVDLSLLLTNRPHTVIEGNEAKQKIARYLQTYPEPAYPWIKDRSGKLPEQFEVNFEDDYQRLYDLIFADIDLLPQTEEIGEQKPIQMPPSKITNVVPEGDFTCESCGDAFTNGDQATLSRIKLRQVLCETCYKEISVKR